MSLTFNDTTTYRGIIQLIERELSFPRAHISGNTNRLLDFTAEVNLAWDNYLAIALTASGKWQFDDSNHTDHPIIKTNLISGRNDYPFTTDENSNLILDIYRVAILESATDTDYVEINPIDQQSEKHNDLLTEVSSSSAPYEYDKTGNTIFLSPTPNYNATNGLKVYINREASYFTTSDTTKKPGCPGLHHKYFALRPSLEYARRLSLKSFNRLAEEVMKMEEEIKVYYSKRAKDEKNIMSPKKILYI